MKRYAVLVLFAGLLFAACAEKQPVSVRQTKTEALSPLKTVEALAAENQKVAHNAIQSIDTYPPEIVSIVKRGEIVFAMTEADQKPFFYVDPASGNLLGLDVELAYAVANRLGVKVTFNRESKSFDAVVNMTANGQADIALSKLSRTLRRAQLVQYTRPYITFRQGLLLNRLQLARVTSEEALPGFIRGFSGKIGVIKNSSYVGYAQANFPSAEVVQFASWDEAVKAVFEGKVLAIYRDELEILKILSERNDASLILKSVFLNDKRDPIAMAVAYNAPMLAQWLDIFLDEYLTEFGDDLTAQKLVNRHFHSK